MTATRSISGLSEVFGLYDGFILDLWGVVHDGTAPFPDTISTLVALQKAKKKVCLLSNAPRRAYLVAEKLTEMGVTSDLYDGLLTSGEACWQALQDGLAAKWGVRCLHMGGTRDESIYEELDIRIVKTPDAADFVLNSGVEDFSDTAEKYAPLLQECAARNLPMICANPDKVVHIKEQLVICAGTLADMYVKMGGTVTYFGKPHRGVYSRCLKAMNATRVLAVGDSMLTDIQGATGAGIDSVLVTSGIHREEFPANGPAEEFLAKYHYRPNYFMKSFSW